MKKKGIGVNWIWMIIWFKQNKCDSLLCNNEYKPHGLFIFCEKQESSVSESTTANKIHSSFLNDDAIT